MRLTLALLAVALVGCPEPETDCQIAVRMEREFRAICIPTDLASNSHVCLLGGRSLDAMAFLACSPVPAREFYDAIDWRIMPLDYLCRGEKE